MSPRVKKALPYLALVAILVGFANFFWFLAESAALGGDALNGKVSAGHYFVSSHGSYTEVSQAAWEWSRVHAISVFITHLLALASMAYLLFRFIFPSLMAGRAPRAATIERARRIRSSGPILAVARSGGQLGEVRFSAPLLEVTVFPGGIVIKPIFMTEHAILASEIGETRARRGVFGQRFEVQHAGIDSTSPFVIYGGDPTLADAIEDVASRARSEGYGEPSSEPPVSASTHPSYPSTAPTPAEIGDRMPAGIMPVLNLAGIAVSVVMIGVGFAWAIPQLGLFGIAWTALAVVITVSNVRRFLSMR